MTLDPQKKQKLLIQIKGLLAKSANLRTLPGYEHEADACMVKVQELLTRYNIELLEVETHEGRGSRKDEVTQITVSIAVQKSHVKEWKRLLGFAIARYNYCKAFGYGPYQMIFVGRKMDVEIVNQIFASLTNQLEIACEVEAKIAQDKGFIINGSSGPTHPRAWRAAFLRVAVETLSRRLRNEHLKMVREDSQTSALVVVRTDEIDRWVKENWGKVHKYQGNNEVNPASASAYQAGTKVGDSLSALSGIRPSDKSGTLKLGSGQ